MSARDRAYRNPPDQQGEGPQMTDSDDLIRRMVDCIETVLGKA
jgi:hypothetical protein